MVSVFRVSGGIILAKGWDFSLSLYTYIYIHILTSKIENIHRFRFQIEEYIYILPDGIIEDIRDFFQTIDSALSIFSPSRSNRRIQWYFYLNESKKDQKRTKCHPSSSNVDWSPGKLNKLFPKHLRKEEILIQQMILLPNFPTGNAPTHLSQKKNPKNDH